jgi:hypothetical protein
VVLTSGHDTGGAGSLDDVRSVRWSSLLTVLGASAVALVFLVVALRGRVWAWVPFVIAVGVAVREVRYLQRSGRSRRAE